MDVFVRMENGNKEKDKRVEKTSVKEEKGKMMFESDERKKERVRTPSLNHQIYRKCLRCRYKPWEQIQLCIINVFHLHEE